jgi:hypothetical protein
MEKQIAFIKNNKVVNIIVAESLEAIKDSIDLFYSDCEVLDVTGNTNIGVYWNKVDGEWQPPVVENI